MSVRDFPPRPQGAPPDSVPHQNWLDTLGQRQNIDLMQELTSVASGDEIAIFDASETGQVKTKKATIANIKTPIMTGTTTNDNAAAGQIGEVMESVLPIGSAISLTNATPANITSITLTAGDWDVMGSTAYRPAATTSLTRAISSTSLTSATIDSDYVAGIMTAAFVPGNITPWILTHPIRRVSVTSNTTVYLIADAFFTVSTLTAYGVIRARRIR